MSLYKPFGNVVLVLPQAEEVICFAHILTTVVDIFNQIAYIFKRKLNRNKYTSQMLSPPPFTTTKLLEI